MKKFLEKAELSFKKSLSGEESIDNLIWFWGAIGYFFAYFIAEKLIRAIDVRLIEIIISVVMVGYFSWHIYALRKCSPKKPKLTKEEKKEIKKEQKKDAGKKFIKKLMLQEPITKSNPAFIASVVDIFAIASFLDYIIR
jgi:hypothetical protein